MPQRRRARIVVLVLVFVSLVLVTIDFRSGEDGPIDRVRGITTAVLRPVQDGVVTLVTPLRDGVGGIGELFDTRAENRELRERIEVLEQRRRSVVDLERENAELRRLLAIRDTLEEDTVTARVVALAPSTFEWTITVDVGTEDGVQRGMPVVSNAGLVGRVVQVQGRSARVLLAIDPNFSAAARLAEDGEIGPIEGRGGDPMVFRPLDPEVEIAVGDEVVTSAYQGGLFPAGIPIGTVSAVGDPTAPGLRREVAVQPFVDFTRLHHVLVVLHEPTETLPPLGPSDDTVFIPPGVDPFVEPAQSDTPLFVPRPDFPPPGLEPPGGLEPPPGFDLPEGFEPPTPPEPDDDDADDAVLNGDGELDDAEVDDAEAAAAPASFTPASFTLGSFTLAAATFVGALPAPRGP